MPNLAHANGGLSKSMLIGLTQSVSYSVIFLPIFS